MNELLLTILTFVVYSIFLYTPEPEIVPHDPDTFIHYTDVMGANIRELKSMCKQAQLPKYGRLTKSELQLALL